MKLFAYAVRLDEKPYFDKWCQRLGVEYAYSTQYPTPENLQLARGYDAISTTPYTLGPADIRRFYELGVKCLAARAVGYDHFDLPTAKELGMPVVPGCITPTEIEAGLEMGLTTFKFFPSEPMNGMATIKQLCGPYGNIQFIPTAGITMDNLENYLSSDKIAAVGGSFMAPSAMVDAQDWAGITALCKKAVDKSLGFTLAHVGINGENKDQGLGAAEWFNRCFGWPVKEGGRSNFAATYVECCNQRFPGKFGHIGVFTLSMRRALAYFKAHGIATREEFKNVNAKGELVAVYLEEEVGGFAVHIVKKS